MFPSNPSKFIVNPTINIINFTKNKSTFKMPIPDIKDSRLWVAMDYYIFISSYVVTFKCSGLFLDFGEHVIFGN